MPVPDMTLEGGAFLPRLPEDRRILTAAEAARLALASSASSAFVGVEGAGPALLSHTLAVQSARQVVHLVANGDVAQQTAADLAALGKGLPLSRVPRLELPAPLLLAPPESTPYAEVHSDRRATMLRTAALHDLLSNPNRTQIVLSVSALLRRVPPRQVLRDATVELVVEQELDVVRLSQQLTAAGYLRAPVV